MYIYIYIHLKKYTVEYSTSLLPLQIPSCKTTVSRPHLPRKTPRRHARQREVLGLAGRAFVAGGELLAGATTGTIEPRGDKHFSRRGFDGSPKKAIF